MWVLTTVSIILSFLGTTPEEQSDNQTHSITEEDCVICSEQNDDQKLITVTAKGLETLTTFSVKRKATSLLRHLKKCGKKLGSKVKVHEICKRNFTDPKR